MRFLVLALLVTLVACCDMQLRRRLAIAIVVLLVVVAFAGCDLQPRQVVALPVPAPEQPACNLPATMHIRNWLGPQRQGSCVHASLKNYALWHNDFAFVKGWPHADGEYASRLMQRLDAAGYDYAFTERADPRFLDWCSQERHGAIVWWKPSHCCTFMGWVSGQDGKQYAAILDNNFPGKFEFTEREQFVRLWAGYGGFGLAMLMAPTISIPYRSYELR